MALFNFKKQFTTMDPDLDSAMDSSKRRKTQQNVEFVLQKCGNEVEQVKSCHQCGNGNEKDGLISCRKCGSHKYCVTCLNIWYPNVSAEKFAEACPVCCKNCNCKACLRGFSPKDMQTYSCSEADKIKYSKHIIQKVFPLMKSPNEDQLMEKEIEAKIKRLSVSELHLQDAECELGDDIFCDNCGAYFLYLYRSCACGYDLCVTCCHDLREGNLGWKANLDGSIPCPSKDIGGCEVGTLELKLIMRVDWVADMIEKAHGVYEINASYDNENETTQEKSNASYLYSINAKYIQPQDMQNFQLHWSKGEPVIVNDVLSTSSGLSWEPMVLWRAFQDIADRGTPSIYAVNAFNGLDCSEETVDLHDFFTGYSEGRFVREGLPLILKLEDWQPSCLSQGELPRHFVEFINCLPFKDYTHPHNGYLNLAVKLPDLSVKPEVGPRLDIAYGDSVTKLHYDKSDTVSVLMHKKSAVLPSTKINKTTIVKQEYVDQNEALVFKSNEHQQHTIDPREGGAIWDIFRRQDIPKLEEYLRNHSLKQVDHPIHDRTFYLTLDHKTKLKQDFGIEPWTFKQKLGDAVFIPAGCPYQVRNLKSNTKIELNFISPESLEECIRLQNELCILPNNHRAKQQRLNIRKMMIYALDKAVADLTDVVDMNIEDSNTVMSDDGNKAVADLPDVADINIEDSNTLMPDDGNKAMADLSDIIDMNIEESNTLMPDDGDKAVANLSDVVDINIEVSNTLMPDDGLWRGMAVGHELKELLQSVEDFYPSTFQRVPFRTEEVWLAILNLFQKVVKRFMDTSVDSLAEGQITNLQEDLKELEGFQFDVTWAHQRLNMVNTLKFRNDPLQEEFTMLEESLELADEKVVESRKVYMEAFEKLKEAQLEYHVISNATNQKKQEMEDTFGADYDRVMKGCLGFGLLPEY